MTVTGTVYLDLREVAPDRQRRRVAVLAAAPDGARVVVVGSLAVQPDAARMLKEQSARLRLDIHGEEYAVRRWLDALRGDDMMGMLL